MTRLTYRDTLAAIVSEIEALCRPALASQETPRVPSLVVGEGLRARSLRALNSDLRNWLGWWKKSGRLGSMALRESVESWVQDMEARGLSPCHICRLLNSVKKMLAAMGWPDPGAQPLIVGIVRSKTLAAGEPRPLPRTVPFGWTAIQRCLHAADDSQMDTRNVAILMVLYDTMARIDDILGYKGGGEWHVFPVQREAFQVLRDGSGVLRIGQPARDAYLSPLTAALVTRWLAFRRPGGGALFLSDRGNPCLPKGWQPSMHPLLVRAGFRPKDMTAFALRLGMGKDLLRGGASIEDVRRTGGWAGTGPVLRLAGAHNRLHPTQHLAAVQGRDHTTSLRLATAHRQASWPRAKQTESRFPTTGDLFDPELAAPHALAPT